MPLKTYFCICMTRTVMWHCRVIDTTPDAWHAVNCLTPVRRRCPLVTVAYLVTLRSRSQKKNLAGHRETRYAIIEKQLLALT